ncbi:hypothetical protein OG978_33225 [Streptomyces sp. NBC_01591]|uniref:hypothetical protein n=1 Tax=Streptomyces sp. NBC_01591 TaxID=2975888 RepID=UPI002DDAD410|nr:hypothetical protein [Streptomyces sp. NBC_01591]WSD71830.1 hypothetical protein OG978_33225 [Streptomyces sp. NBC_01591]
MKRTFLGAVLAAGLLAAVPAAPAVGSPARDTDTAATTTVVPLADSWKPPLSTRGRYVVDAEGNRFKLKSANWHGAQGSWNGSGDISVPANHHDSEKSDQMPLGLDRVPIATMLSDFHELGINSIRLPFSNEMLHDQRPVSDAAVAANPGLRGKTPLVQSLRVRSGGDWDPGARKGVCPDGQRITGVSHRDGRGLCTDTGGPGLADPAGGFTVVTDERHVQQGDRASGYTKYQCPQDRFMTGYSVRGQAVSGVLCSSASHALPTTGRAVWFDRGDNRPAGGPGGEFATGNYKGQCATDEYAAGIAFTCAWAKGRTPDALLCREL